jgi:hypothetical protein
MSAVTPVTAGASRGCDLAHTLRFRLRCGQVRERAALVLLDGDCLGAAQPEHSQQVRERKVGRSTQGRGIKNLRELELAEPESRRLRRDLRPAYVPPGSVAM